MGKAVFGTLSAILIAVATYWLTDGFSTLAEFFGLKEGPPSATMSVAEENTDRPHSDYKDLAVSSFEECQNVCLADDKCQAVSFNKTANQCWLKNGEPLRVADPNFTSSVKHLH